MPGRQGQRPEYQEAGPGCWLVRGCRAARSAPGTRAPRLCLSWDVPPRSEGLLSPWSTGKGMGESERQKEEGVSLIDGTLASCFFDSPVIYAACDFSLQRSQRELGGCVITSSSVSFW